MKKDLPAALARFIQTWRKTVLVALIAVTLFFSLGLPKLYFYNKFTSWLDQDDPVSALFIELSDRFSINELIVVALESEKEVFDPAVRDQITAFCEELQTFEEVFAVNSLSTMVDISRSPEGDLTVEDLLERARRFTPAEFAEYVVSKELYRSQIVSADKKTAMISIFIRGEFDSEKVLKEKIMPLSRKTFAAQHKLYFSGVPVNAHFLNLYAIRDVTVLSPLIFGLICLILFLSFRSLQGVLFPLLTVVLATVWTFGLIGHIGAPLTFVTAIIPVLLVALGSAYGIHIVNHYQQRDISGPDRKARITKATAEIFLPVILAGVTTFIGFLSFLTAGLTLISDFGLFSALGILFALIISLTLVPVLTSFFPGKGRGDTPHDQRNPLSSRLARFIISRAKPIFIFCTGLIILFALFIPRIDREVNFVEYFPKDSLPYLSHKLVEAKFHGDMPVIADFRSPNCKSPGMLRLLRKTENTFLGYGLLSKPLSIATLLAELNFQLNERHALPEGQSAVGTLWFFIEGRKELDQIIAGDEQETLVFSRFPDPRTKAQRRLQAYLEAFADQVARGAFVYQLGELPTEAGSRVRKLELEALSGELRDLLRGYGQKEPHIVAAADLFLKGCSFWQPGELDPGIIEETVDRTLTGPDFDWALTQPQTAMLRSTILSGLTQDPDSLPAAINGFAARVKTEAMIDDAALEDLAETLAYKIREEHENRWVSARISELRESTGVLDEQAHKRMATLFYDAIDQTALLINPPDGLPALGQALEASLRISGFPALMMQLDSSLFNSQVQSIVLAYLLTLLLMVIIYRSLRLGFAATVPIVFTVAIVYGSLGLLGISLDYATMLTGAVAIGVGIDYSIHLLHGVITRTREGLSLEDALQQAISEKAPAIMTNAVSVLAGFMVLLFSSMLILRNFGATMMAAMVLAAFAAIFYLPSILITARKYLGLENRRNP
jgi:predicted RND superfamily exporter protein